MKIFITYIKIHSQPIQLDRIQKFEISVLLIRGSYENLVNVEDFNLVIAFERHLCILQ